MKMEQGNIFIKQSYPHFVNNNFPLVFPLENTYPSFMPKRTFQPKKIKRARKHGFRCRMKSRDGRKTLKRRREKGRKRISF